MVRPRINRRVRFEPDALYYKPQGVPLSILEEVSLCLEEVEALRLKDYQGLDQKRAAEKMGVSQPTFHRILKEARRKVSEALVKGKAIKITKERCGNYQEENPDKE